jgi:D-glycero-D-manno-heptose 1,7-bisphosphate phosphatase
MTFWVFLVGGKGTRLGSLTTDTPKPLLPVGGRPFLDYLLDRAVHFGASEILLLAGHLAGKVAVSYHERPWNGVPVRCHVEAEPLGTAGALRQASALLPARWVLMNGDTLFEVDPARLDQPGEDWLVSMALRRLDDTGRSGTVALEDGWVRDFQERGTGGPGLVNAGVYCMRREILDLIPADGACSLEAEIFPRLAKSGRIRGTVLDGYFIDIGVPEDYIRARREVPGRALPSVKCGPL